MNENDSYKTNELFLPIKFSCFLCGMFFCQAISSPHSLILDAVITLLGGIFFGGIFLLFSLLISTLVEKRIHSPIFLYLVGFLIVFFFFNSSRIIR